MNNDALFKLSYGLFILTAQDGGEDNGCVINTVMQITAEPMRVCVCVNKTNYTHEMIEKSGEFNVSVISENADFKLFRRFGFSSGRDTDKFKNYGNCKRSENGIYYITEGTNAYISVEVCQKIDVGTHTMFIGDVRQAEILSDTPSATYEYYFKNIKPKPQPKPETNGKKVWRCKICGYRYIGDELPDDYICPICKHTASDFEIM